VEKQGVTGALISRDVQPLAILEYRVFGVGGRWNE
jgi:hypothetical protein